MTKITNAFVALIVLLASSSAFAATAHYTVLQTSPTTFDLLFEASQGDNGGLAGFSFELAGAGQVQNLAPRQLVGATPFAGFTAAVSGDDEAEVTGGQNTTSPTSIIYGIGQTPGSFSVDAPFAGVPGDGVYDSPVLLASGTISDVLAMSSQSLPGITNLFDQSGEVSATAVEATWEFVAIPEPTSFVLLGLGMIGLVGYRRRK